jgi:hypothetical protein
MEHPSVDMNDFVAWRQLCQASIDLLKGAAHDLPSGSSRKLTEEKIRHAEDMLARADAMLAKELGMLLCDCTWPPQIMRRRQSIHYCPNCNRQLGGRSNRDEPRYNPFRDFMTS